MLNIQSQFEWQRPRKRTGFEWEKCAGGQSVPLVPGRVVPVPAETVRLAPAPGAVFENYRPLEKCTGLFRTFADLHNAPPDRFLHFANRYGMLGTGNELLEAWQGHTERMRTLVEVWDAWNVRNENGLRRALARV